MRLDHRGGVLLVAMAACTLVNCVAYSNKEAGAARVQAKINTQPTHRDVYVVPEDLWNDDLLYHPKRLRKYWKGKSGQWFSTWAGPKIVVVNCPVGLRTDRFEPKVYNSNIKEFLCP